MNMSFPAGWVAQEQDEEYIFNISSTKTGYVPGTIARSNPFQMNIPKVYPTRVLRIRVGTGFGFGGGAAGSPAAGGGSSASGGSSDTID